MLLQTQQLWIHRVRVRMFLNRMDYAGKAYKKWSIILEERCLENELSQQLLQESVGQRICDLSFCV